MLPRVCEDRRACIGDDGHGLAFHQARQDILGFFGFVVFIEEDQVILDPQLMENAAALAVFFTDNGINLRQYIARPQGDIFWIAYGGGDYIKLSAFLIVLHGLIVSSRRVRCETVTACSGKHRMYMA